MMRTEQIVDFVYDLVEACDRRDVDTIANLRDGMVKAWDDDATRLRALESEVARYKAALEEIHRVASRDTVPFGDTALLESVTDIAWEALGRPEALAGGE